MIIARRTFCALSCITVLAAASTIPGQAQSARRFLYAALPGFGGGSSLDYGGSGILVFDIDREHRFVRRIPLGSPPDARGRRAVRGIAAHAATNRLYVTTNTGLTAYDLRTDQVVWHKTYGLCCDRLAVSPDGRILYVPPLDLPRWHVVEALSGALIASVEQAGIEVQTDKPRWTSHNTLFSHDGTHVYLESWQDTRLMSVVDGKTHKVVKTIGPFGHFARPFTINAAQTLLFANVNDLLGFEIADVKSGKILHRVEVPGVRPGKSPGHGIPSHGIALTQDETEVWIADNANNHLRIFDVTKMPPVLKTAVEVRDEPGWITFGIDGRLAYSSTGEVIDVVTKRIVATLQDENARAVQSEKMLQVDFADGKPVRAGDQFARGGTPVS